MKDFKSLRIVFMGTPEFAVASLDALVKAGCNIVGVVTAPDKPGGRGMQLQQSAVKKYAVDHGLNVLQPEKLKNADFINTLRSLDANLQVVVAFRMLPEIVWNMPPMGTINVHGSLLPQYRGAAPINWAVINGEKETGVTTFKLKHEIDTGDILLQEIISIDANETAGQVHDKMKDIGAALLVKTVIGLAENTLQEKPQAITVTAKHAPKIFSETCKINWNNSVDSIHNQIRGLAPYPAAFTQLNGKTCKIVSSTKTNETPAIAPGEWHTDGKTFLQFAATDGYVYITVLQMEGKKRMTIEEFLRGFRIV